MADLRYRVDIDTKGAQQSLSGLRTAIAGFGAAIAGAFSFREFSRVSAQLDDLRRTLQTLYRDAGTGAQAFSEVGQLANDLGVDINTLAESVIKLKAAGIKPTTDQLRLFADVASVSTDRVGALQSITDLFTRTMGGGLGLEELERLQDRGIPVYDILIEKLGKSRLELSEFGKTAKGAEVIRAALQQGLQERFGGASAQRADSLSSAMSRLSNSFKTAVDTLGQAGLNQIITDVANTITVWISKNKEVIIQFGQGFAKAFKVFIDNLGLVIAAAKIFFVVFAAKKIADLVLAFASLNKVIGKSPLVLIAAGALAAANAMGAFDGVLEKISKAFGAGSDDAVELAKGIKEVKDSTDGVAGSSGVRVLTDGGLPQGVRDYRKEIEALNEKLAQFRVEQDGIVNTFKRVNAERLAAINLETSLIGATSESSRILQEQQDISNKAAQEIAKLREQKAKLTEQDRKEGRGTIIDQTIAKIEQQAEIDKKATEEAIRNSEARQRARQVELFAIQSQISLQEQVFSIQSEIAKLTMTEIEKKYYDIEEAAKRSARAAIQAEEARIGRPLSLEEQRRYYEEAAKGIDELKQKTREQYEQSRTFSVGWKQAMNEYVDDATNAAKTAKDIFTKATKGMEDAIVNFAKTGKFQFKDFMSSILEDLLRSQVRQLMGQIFNLGGNRSGVTTGSFLGNLLGFANGGIIPTNNPVLVGERGPELISGAAGRVVTPNEQLGGNVVNYNISAVDAASFKALVASDPGFIHAVVMQGASSIPSRR